MTTFFSLQTQLALNKWPFVFARANLAFSKLLQSRKYHRYTVLCSWEIIIFLFTDLRGIFLLSRTCILQEGFLGSYVNSKPVVLQLFSTETHFLE